MIINILCIAVVFAISYVGILLFRVAANRIGLADIPNDRSSHSVSKNRGAGVIFIIMFLAYVLGLYLAGMLPKLEFLGLFLPTLLVSLVGLIDDIIDLPAFFRFIAYIIAAAIAFIVCYRFSEFYTWYYYGLAGFITLFLITWSINLFNFMDGSDGMAGMEAIFIFIFSCFAFCKAGAVPMMLISAVLICSIFVFLLFNWPPAKVFMGDVGSAGLGCIIAVFMLIGHNFYHLPFTPWLIMYSLFVFDATVTLMLRIMAGEKWYHAHRSHAYQKLLRSGKSHLRVLICAITVNIALFIFALAALYHPTLQLKYLIISIIFLGALYILANCIFYRSSEESLSRIN